MALQNTRVSNYAQWYQDVIVAADMAELSASPGCMVMKPWGYGIWERIQRTLDDRIKETGHENCYFPMLIPLSFLQKEAEHVDGFAKEMAVVTHTRLEAKEGKLVLAGPLEEPLIVRPTSETIIADSFAKWIRSYRDLPVMINQWANVMRWEMRPRLFLRTREFLWQEGHTAHASYEEAETEAHTMLDVYANFCENVLSMPVIKGKKPEYDKFPGAVDTYCVEAMMQDGRALQAGTSHFLGQNFARSADIKFQTKSGTQDYAYTTSWGVSTRLIGGLIMTHADDEGMVVPPKIAPYQVVIVPIIKKEEDRDFVMQYAEHLYRELKEKMYDGERVRVKLDLRDKSNVDKNWEWTRKGVPFICEIGPKDIEKNSLFVWTRTNINLPDWKQSMLMEEFIKNISNNLSDIQNSMYKKAAERLIRNQRMDIKTPLEFKDYFSSPSVYLDGGENPVGFVRGKWGGDPATLDMMKEMKISIRCIPDDQSGTEGACLLTGKPATLDVIYAKSY